MFGILVPLGAIFWPLTIIVITVKWIFKLFFVHTVLKEK